MASIGCYLNTRNGRNTLGAKVTICMQEQSNWPTNSMNQIQGSQLGFRSILRKRSFPTLDYRIGRTSYGCGRTPATKAEQCTEDCDIDSQRAAWLLHRMNVTPTTEGGGL